MIVANGIKLQREAYQARSPWIFMWVIILSTGQGNYVRCSQAFLFSMVNPHGLGPTKLPLLTGKEQYAICCGSSTGPTFGGGNDLCISSNANTNTSSYSNLGFSYQCPPGQQNTFFTGAKNFTVTDYEVFSLDKWRQSWNWVIQVPKNYILFLLLYKAFPFADQSELIWLTLSGA